MSQSPKLFISYSWSSPQHEEWVLSLATELRENGVDVVLDKWDLKEGNNAHAFMERMVFDPEIKKVALICDRDYAEKADQRSKGVGIETQIITAEIYAKQDQNKFVAVLPERDEKGEPFLPIYYKSRIFIDISSPELYGRNFEQLLRWVFDKPRYAKPELGKMPVYLNDDDSPTLETSSRYRRVLEAIRENRPYCSGALQEYFDTFSQNLERFRIVRDSEEFDEKVIHNIEAFIPYRNEILDVFSALARYRDTEESWNSIHRFYEILLPYLDRPAIFQSWQETDIDNFRFIIHELFLYTIAILLKHERFPCIAYLVSQHYYFEPNVKNGLSPMVSFSRIRSILNSLQYQNKRLKLNRLSLHADILIKRTNSNLVSRQNLMQSDFVLYLRDCFDYLRTNCERRWWPITLVYAREQYGPFEIFARSQSRQYFERVKTIFGIIKTTDFELLIDAFKSGKLSVPERDSESVDVLALLNYTNLAILP